MLGRLLCWLGFHKYYIQDLGSKGTKILCLREDCIYRRVR